LTQGLKLGPTNERRVQKPEAVHWSGAIQAAKADLDEEKRGSPFDEKAANEAAWPRP
jgi:hypothetical protein